jgi:hypothetical protein
VEKARPREARETREACETIEGREARSSLRRSFDARDA